MGNVTETQKTIENLIEKGKANAELHYLNALAFYKQANFNKTKQELNRALNYQSGYPPQ